VSKIILASASPRRAQLLESCGVSFEICAASILEEKSADEKPQQFAIRVAKEKANVVSKKYPTKYVLAADTIVVVKNLQGELETLGKPKDKQDARLMLAKLSGETHLVYTAFCLMNKSQNFEEAQIVSTEVTFAVLGDEDIANYVDTGECSDKAGAYALQGIGGAFVSKLNGSFTNVIGLPLVEVLAMLAKVGAWDSSSLLNLKK
jgi:septum formation protein